MFRRETGSVILKIAYGYKAEPHGSDPLVDMAGNAMINFARAGVPGAFLVDILPFCKTMQYYHEIYALLCRN